MLNIITCFMLLDFFVIGRMSLRLRKCTVMLVPKSAATATTGHHHNTVTGPGEGRLFELTLNFEYIDTTFRLKS